MLAKARLGILQAFQPYQSLQAALSGWTGQHVHAAVPWLISYLNGSTAAGFLFARLCCLQPDPCFTCLNAVVRGILKKRRRYFHEWLIALSLQAFVDISSSSASQRLQAAPLQAQF
jgi:hypothetical protein